LIGGRGLRMKKLSNNLKGIIYILLGMFIIAFQDIAIKILSINTNLFLILFFRSVIGVIIILIFLKFTKRPIVFKTHFPLLTLARCLLLFTGFSCFFISLSVLSYPIAVTLFFASPLSVTILSKFILQENIGFRRWGAVLVGFVGVYLVMNPKLNNLNIYTLFPVFTAMAYATTIVIQHKTADKDSLFAQTFHILFAAILFSLVAGIVLGNGQFDIYESEALQFMFRKWEISFDTSLALLIVIGFSYSIGISFIFHAYRIASPASIAPFEYILIFYAMLLGWIIWRDAIDLQSVIGLTLIVGGGLYTFFREIKRKRLVSVQKPLR
jgi:drug/metabolite transporter (DMT)-like permease